MTLEIIGCIVLELFHVKSGASTIGILVIVGISTDEMRRDCLVTASLGPVWALTDAISNTSGLLDTSLITADLFSVLKNAMFL